MEDIETKTTKYPVIIVRTSESTTVFGGPRQLSTVVIKTFKNDKWSGLKCAHDSLVKNAEITIKDNSIIITGTKSIFHNSLFRVNYGKRYELFDEFHEDGRKRTIEEVQENLAYHSMRKLIVKDSDIKLFYDGFWDFIKRKRTYYLDTTPEVISHLSHVAIHEIKKDKKGYYTDGWHDTNLTEPYKIETNNYIIEEN